MYHNCKHLLNILKNTTTHNAHQVLDQILTQTITTGLVHATPTWNSILRAYSKSPTPIKVILIYNHYIRKNFITFPDHYTYPPIFKACSRILSLPKGKELHANVIKVGLDYDVYVQNALIHFYGSMAQVSNARHLFDKMPTRDIVSWNSMLNAYNDSSDSWNQVLILFKRLIHENVRADRITLMIILSACARVEGIVYGSGVHGYVIKVGLECILKLENALLGTYTRCREMNAALRLFNEMVSRRDLVSHTILIKGYAEMGLVDSASNIFYQIAEKDLVMWSSMMRAYVKADRPNEALYLFERMNRDGVIPDENTVVSVIAACAALPDLQYGRMVHRFILRNGIRQDVFVGTALIDMYSKCGSLEESLVTFFKMDNKDVFTWTTLIEGLATNGHEKEALRMFRQMQKQGIEPNEATFVSVLMSCSRSGLIDEGCQLFIRMVEFYGIQPKIEHFGCLVDLLSRAGLLHQAEEFIKMMLPEERLIAYKTLLSGCINYSEFNLGEKVANEIRKMGYHSHATHILMSNFYALADQWSEVEETRKIVKELNMIKEPGISSLELKS